MDVPITNEIRGTNKNVKTELFFHSFLHAIYCLYNINHRYGTCRIGEKSTHCNRIKKGHDFPTGALPMSCTVRVECCAAIYIYIYIDV